MIRFEDIVITAHEEELLQALLGDRDYAFSEPKENSIYTLTLVLIRISSARWFTRASCSHELLVGARFMPDTDS